MRSYQKDLASFKETQNSKAGASNAGDGIPETAKPASADGEQDVLQPENLSAGNLTVLQVITTIRSAAITMTKTPAYTILIQQFEKPGKWVKQEEAFASSQLSAADSQNHLEPKSSRHIEQSSEAPKPVTEGKNVVKHQSGTAPGLVVSASQNPLRPIKGAPSSIAVNKRKRDNGKPKVVSKEEEAALRAREAAKKRVEEREKSLLGLYKSY